MKHRLSFLLAAAALLAGPLGARAQDQNSPEARLRDALKSTMVQLRTITTDRDNLQAQVTDLQSQKDTLTQQVGDLTKKAAATQDADAKEIADLKTEKIDQETSIASLQQQLTTWKDAQKKAYDAATAIEAKRAKLAELSIHLQRMVDDQKRRNDEMYKLGMELLDRYEKFGLGQAIVAKEPFVGLTRAKFETLVQDYEDKLVDQRITDQSTPGQKPKQ